MEKSVLPVAVVTGASRGLGKAIALMLAKNGYCIAVNYLQSVEKAKEIIAQAGENGILIEGDVSNRKHVEKMADKVYKRWGRLDVLINNAGITKDGLMIKMPEEDWDNVLKINLKGCFNTMQIFSQSMIKSSGGHIINISSYSGLKGKEGQAAYSASKAAVLGLTYTAARELAEHNIMVNALLPGYMSTEMGKSAGKAMQKAKEESISGTLSEPEEAARFILYLIQTKGITGQVFSLDSRII